MREKLTRAIDDVKEIGEGLVRNSDNKFYGGLGDLVDLGKDSIKDTKAEAGRGAKRLWTVVREKVDQRIPVDQDPISEDLAKINLKSERYYRYLSVLEDQEDLRARVIAAIGEMKKMETALLLVQKGTSIDTVLLMLSIPEVEASQEYQKLIMEQNG